MSEELNTSLARKPCARVLTQTVLYATMGTGKAMHCGGRYVEMGWFVVAVDGEP